MPDLILPNRSESSETVISKEPSVSLRHTSTYFEDDGIIVHQTALLNELHVFIDGEQVPDPISEQQCASIESLVVDSLINQALKQSDSERIITDIIHSTFTSRI